MSLDPVMPPYNASDPSATFLSSSCLDFLLIELVPLAYRVAHERDFTPQAAEANGGPTVELGSIGNRAVSSGSGAVAGSSSAPRKLDEEEELDAVHFRLESLGYRVGQGLVERYVGCAPSFRSSIWLMSSARYSFSKDRPRFNDTLDVIKFLCKDLWSLVFGKNIDNLKTNHRVCFRRS